MPVLIVVKKKKLRNTKGQKYWLVLGPAGWFQMAWSFVAAIETNARPPCDSTHLMLLYPPCKQEEQAWGKYVGVQGRSTNIPIIHLHECWYKDVKSSYT
jgi:hypothetical protein